MGSLRFRFCSSFADLPLIAADWWQSSAKDSIFLTPFWFETLIETALDPGDEIAIGCLQEGDQPIALLPCRFTTKHRLVNWRRLESITGPYSCLFHPLIADKRNASAIARALGEAVGQNLLANDSIWFDAVDGEWAALDAFVAGLAAAGFETERYDHFGNWSEPLLGRSSQEYFSARDGSLQEIRRRKGRTARRRGVTFRIVSAVAEVDAGIAEYEWVYARSWKVPEPYKEFHPAFIRNSATRGALRLGVCRVEDRPVAAQLWTVWNETATVMKLAHDEAFAKWSIGTLLTAHMISELIERDAVTEIDFGRGDDDYKRLWTTRRKQRIGLISSRPRSLVGSMQYLRRSLRTVAGKRRTEN